MIRPLFAPFNQMCFVVGYLGSIIAGILFGFFGAFPSANAEELILQAVIKASNPIAVAFILADAWLAGRLFLNLKNRKIDSISATAGVWATYAFSALAYVEFWFIFPPWGPVADIASLYFVVIFGIMAFLVAATVVIAPLGVVVDKVLLWAQSIDSTIPKRRRLNAGTR